MSVVASVLIVEPQEVLRRGLVGMVSTMPGFVSSWAEARSLEDVGADIATEHSIMVVPAIEAASSPVPVRDLFPWMKTILLIPTDEPGHLEMALRVDAAAYMLLPELTHQTFRTTLRQVTDGTAPLPASVAAHLLRKARGDDSAGVPGGVRLSPREEEVLQLVVRGESNQQIANSLGISIHGAKRHVSSILSKMNSPSRAHVISRAIRSGLVSASLKR